MMDLKLWFWGFSTCISPDWWDEVGEDAVRLVKLLKGELDGLGCEWTGPWNFGRMSTMVSHWRYSHSPFRFNPTGRRRIISGSYRIHKFLTDWCISHRDSYPVTMWTSTGMTVTAWPGHISNDCDRYHDRHHDRQLAWPWPDLTEGFGHAIPGHPFAKNPFWEF